MAADPKSAEPRRAIVRGWRRLPLRIRLVAGFAAAMLVVLTGAGAFVYLRVQYALDLSLNEDLAAETTQLTRLAQSGALSTGDADGRIPAGALFQILDSGNHVLAHGDGLAGPSLLRADQADRALIAPIRKDRGALLPISGDTLRISGTPINPGAKQVAGQPAVLVVAVRRGQRDEALRELIGQLTLANLAALAVASFVGYRLTRAALAPVERYRTQAAEIAAGAAGVRLAVPDEAQDEIARLGRTLNDMLTALDAAVDTERRFVHDASHELRTPLTLLSAELELALRRPRSVAELEATIRAAASDTADLIALAETLLTVGVPDIDAGTTANDISVLVADVVNRYRATGNAIEARIEPGVVADADPARLAQVVTNLLDNAIRHGAGPITVTVARHGRAALIAIDDSGPGMDPDFLPHATERFSRADTARATPGTGLGLAVVTGIVGAHHGEMRLCSRGNHEHRPGAYEDIACLHRSAGTTATVLIPVIRSGSEGSR
jgi:two-component system, OmpR family, sensor kinase